MIKFKVAGIFAFGEASSLVWQLTVTVASYIANYLPQLF